MGKGRRSSVEKVLAVMKRWRLRQWERHREEETGQRDRDGISK